MVGVSPFRRFIYNKEKIGSLDDVMSPPYDIISPDMQGELYEKHLYNFVRLILGKQYPDDTDENNRYTRAKKDFEEWIKKNILIQTNKPAIYPYRIEYTIGNQKKMMKGFFILLKLDPTYKTIKAHEKTLSKPKEDRLNLLRACKANLEPIQLLYIDEEDFIQNIIDRGINTPLISVKGYDSFTHKLWILDDEETIRDIQDWLKDKILFIADGHHRYQTAVDYAEEMKQKTGKNGPYDYRMVILANMLDEGLAILPTHRLIKSSIPIDKLIEEVREYFDVEEYKSKVDIKVLKEKLEGKGHRFILYTRDKYYLLILKDEKIMDKFASDRSKTWRTLDVSILHKIIIENIMGITPDILEEHVKYTRDDEEAIRVVDNGEYDLSFLMNPTRIEELKAVAEAGEHMPQKSTYFLPKMLSGLVIYKME
ncbi:MAG TPA: DUF1015 domain-containing protein [Thermoplasmatales archaeon]|nr:DUF1015 domain-containing protein [Thermoplasmatales archaeon]